MLFKTANGRNQRYSPLEINVVAIIRRFINHVTAHKFSSFEVVLLTADSAYAEPREGETEDAGNWTEDMNSQDNFKQT
jgi:hypothetical protein